MRNELLRQELLKELLKEHYGKGIQVYARNDFINKTTTALERPDLIITNPPLPDFKFKSEPNLNKPIGIELKDTQTFGDTVEGIHQSQKYLLFKYYIKETNEEINLGTMAFTTSNAIKNGTICKKFEDNKGIERFSWKLKAPILINHEQNLCWSFRNKYFTLDGKLYGGFGKHAIFYKY